jgi:hypothetical protein
VLTPALKLAGLGNPYYSSSCLDFFLNLRLNQKVNSKILLTKVATFLHSNDIVGSIPRPPLRATFHFSLLELDATAACRIRHRLPAGTRYLTSPFLVYVSQRSSCECLERRPRNPTAHGRILDSHFILTTVDGW